MISGATSGIGKEVAKVYINKRYRVGIAGRRIKELEQIQATAPDLIEIQQIDVTQDSAITNLEDRIERLGVMELLLLSSCIGRQNKE